MQHHKRAKNNTRLVVVAIMLAIAAVGLAANMINTKQRRNRMEQFVVTQEQQSYEVPRTIWAYWDDPKPPRFVVDNIMKWHKILKGWSINLLNRETIHVPSAIADGLARIEHQSDWIRLHLLREYGGVWMDVGIQVNAPALEALEGLRNESMRVKSQWTGYKLNEKHENWFIMAPKRSLVIRAWFDEYEQAVRMGFKAYKVALLKEGVKINDIYGYDEDVYLTQHACLRAVLTRMQNKNGARVPMHPMIAMDAYESMFKIHGECKWEVDCIRLRVQNGDVNDIPFIKMRGMDRAGTHS